jgi:outer membrane protein assembly factor BamB
MAWSKSYSDTRSTPTIENDRIYLISGMGEVICLALEDGTIIWTVNAHEKYKGELHRWGVAESPLIVDDKVIYVTGGTQTSVIALNKLTGKEMWTSKSLGDPKAFVSPIIYKNGSVRQIVAVTAKHIVGLDPATGEIQWQYQNLPDESDADAYRRATIKANSPIYKGNELYYSRGYDQSSYMIRISDDGKSVSELWTGDVMDTHHGGYVNIGDHIYASNWESNSKGKWGCIEWSTGKVLFEETWNTKGSIIYADGMLYCYEERSGNVALVNPNPQKFEIISTFKITDGSGPHWAHPYIAEDKLLIRHGEVLFVYNIGQI